uniref:neutrophil cytosolic factor 1-like isoform X2 n=1 Tax=Myxine glutinosa TaxID=7769 RepID=UPI00358E6BE3
MSETNNSESTCTGCLCGVEVLGSEIRQNPSQHVVYILVVRWSDGSESVIHRQYAEFRNLYAVLVEKLPIETGQICETDKVIPALSGSPWGWQSCIDARQKAIANFCRAVASLPRARRLICVSNLFRPRPEELECGNDSLQRIEVSKTSSSKNHLEISAPIILPTYRARASYPRKNKMELSFQQGDLLEVVSKSSSGWWLCLLPPQRGWAPASLLELVDIDSDMGLEEPDLEGLLYEVTQDYEKSEADELTLSRGAQVRVIYRPPDGWWVVRMGEELGYFPAVFLRPAGADSCCVLEKVLTKVHLSTRRQKTHVLSLLDLSLQAWIQDMKMTSNPLHKSSSSLKAEGIPGAGRNKS